MKEQGLRLIQGNRLEEARALFQKLCDGQPADAALWNQLASLNGMLGRLQDAEQCCRKVISLQPDHCEAHLNLGNIAWFRNRHEEAVDHYRTALRINPALAGAHNNLGSVLLSMGRGEEAQACFREAIRLNPRLVDAHFNLGNLYKAQGRLEEAAGCYRQVLRLNPDHAAACNNLGGVLYSQGQWEAALDSYRQALRIAPNHAESYNDMGCILSDQGRLAEGAAMFERALGIDPDSAEACFNLAAARSGQGRPEEAIELYRKVLRLQPHRADAHSVLLLNMHYVPLYTREEILAASREWARRHAPRQPCLAPPANDPDPRRALRVGYVSADLYGHPVGFFVEPVLAHHDRERVQVYCYSGGTRRGEQHERLRGLCDHWRDISGLSDEQSAACIRRDGIDVLVDLAGHTGSSRLPVFGHRPAPVQATWLGYFDTTGLDAIDYIIADPHLIGPDMSRYYVEEVARLPHCFLCYLPPACAPEPGETPAAAAGGVTFGCFNHPAKVSPPVVECWAAVLQAVPGSTLLLKSKWYADEQVRERLRRAFAGAGIDPERLRFAGMSPRPEYLAAHRQVDIALDPFPYNGGTITADALWMGVPVISLRGDRFAGRMGESILSAAGLDEFLADSRDEYVAKATALAGDLPRLGALRARLRQRLASSPLCDGAAFTRDLEDLYRGMWERWCRGRRERSP